MTDQVYTDSKDWINACHSFSDRLWPEAVPEKWHVSALQTPVMDQLYQAFSGSGPSRCISVAGHGGCGKTALFSAVAENEAFSKRHHIVYTSLIQKLHLLDITVYDVLFMICLSLIKALKESDIEPPAEEFSRLFHSLLQEFKLDEKDPALPERLFDEIKINTAFRHDLRQILKNNSEDLIDLINLVCKKIARNTYGCFRLDGDAFEHLKHEEVSETILSKLTDMKDRDCRSEVTFIREVEKRIGNIQTIHYKPVMLKHAWSETAMRPMVLIDDMDKLPRPIFSEILKQWPDFVSQTDADLVLTLPVSALYDPSVSNEKALGNRIVLPPLALNNRDGSRNTEAAALMEQAAVSRLNGLPVSKKGITHLINQSGGIIRNLIHSMKHACRIVIERGADSIDEDIAVHAAEETGAVYQRFFNVSEDAAFIKSVIKTKSSEGIPPEKLAYLLRHQFLIRYGGKEAESWYEANPCLKESLL